MEIEVKGHSGCEVAIVGEGTNPYIYKSTRDKSYFPRLLLQAKKQEEASKLEYQHTRVPQIYEIVQNEDEVGIKMEYVFSKNYIEYFESAGFEQINYFIKAIVLFIEKELKQSPTTTLDKHIVVDKFEDVKRKVMANSLLQTTEIKSMMTKSEAIFLGMDNVVIPMGVCHGDLTFSNILFNGNNYYLIDFLDSFVESPLLDIVKIRQDSAYLWSQLMYIHDFDKIRLQLISAKIDKELDCYFEKYEWYQKWYYHFQLMNFLRILQYAKEEKVIDYLKNESTLINR